MTKPNLLMMGTALMLAAPLAWAARPDMDCRAIGKAAFSSLPMLIPVGRDGRDGASYCMVNLRADRVEVRDGAGGFAAAPDSVPARDGGFEVSAGKTGNYHWLQAGEDTQQGVVTATTAHFFANPGPAPTAMLELPKSELELVPRPLPREHWHYRVGETWNFVVRFRGRPVANAGVRLETGGGTQTVFRSDAHGIVHVTFPNDVSDVAPKGRHSHGGQNGFVLAVALTDPQGRYYLTAFNQIYAAAFEQGRSLSAGLGFLALGGLIAVPLVIRRKDKNHA